jgi:hypothetical protein
MSWIVGWFQERYWEISNREWDKNDKYTAPPVLKTFMVIYDQRPNEARIYRPLNPESVVDADIRRQMAD